MISVCLPVSPGTHPVETTVVSAATQAVFRIRCLCCEIITLRVRRRSSGVEQSQDSILSYCTFVCKQTHEQTSFSRGRAATLGDV